MQVSANRSAHPHDVQSLLNWNLANGCISRADMDFLNHRDDLICLSPPRDGLVLWLERHVSEKLLLWTKVSRNEIGGNIETKAKRSKNQSCRSDISRDQR